MGLVNHPNDISLSRANQSQAKFKSCGREFAAKLGEFDYTVEFNHFLEELKLCFDAFQAPTPNVVLFEDFNLPHAKWDLSGWSADASKEEQNMIKVLYNVTLENFLTQQVECPTHQEGKTLDLVFTNNSNSLHNVCAFPSWISDHYIIETTNVLEPLSGYLGQRSAKHRDGDDCTTPLGFQHLNFFSEDARWDSLMLALSEYDWTQELRGLDTKEMVSKFTSICLSISKMLVPLKKRTTGSNQRKHSQIPMRRKRRLKEQLLKAKSEARRNSIMAKLIDMELKIQDCLRHQSD